MLILILLKMKSRTDEEESEYSRKTRNLGVIFGFRNLGVIFGFKLKSATYKLYDLGQVLSLSFSIFMYKIRTDISILEIVIKKK